MKMVEIRQTIKKHTTKVYTPEEVIIAIPKRGMMDEMEDEENEEE